MLSFPMRLRTWTGLPEGEKTLVLNTACMFLYCFLSCMIKLYKLRGFLHVACAFPIFTQYQKWSVLHSWLYYFSGEESVAGNWIILSSPVMCWWRAMFWIGSKAAALTLARRQEHGSIWFLSQNNWCQLMRNAGNSCSKSHCFYYVTRLPWVRMWWAGICVWDCFFSAIHSFSVKHTVANLVAKSALKENLQNLTWQWLMTAEGFNTVSWGHQWEPEGKCQLSESSPLFYSAD